MRPSARLAAAAAALSAVCAAAPALAGEGVYITIDGGYSMWGRNAFKEKLPGQVGEAETTLLVDKQMPDGGIFGLHLGYNVGGHAAFEGNLVVHPWNVLDKNRGGVGLVGMAGRWFPLHGLIRPQRQFDLSFLAGINYVLMGGNGDADTDNDGRGFDGMAVELGGTVELYPAKWVSLGITPRMYFLDPIRYFRDFDSRETGGSIPLAGKVTSTLFSINLSVSFHFEPLPD